MTSMRRVLWPVLRPVQRAVLLAPLTLLTSLLPGQVVSTKGDAGFGSGQELVVRSGRDVSFALLASQAQASTFQADQIRRFWDATGRLVAAREQLTVAGNGTSRPLFQLAFAGLDAASSPSTDPQKWTRLYQRYASLFHEHGGFRVHDAAQAAINYTLTPLGTAVRAGRDVERVVVFPRRVGKSIWLIEVDRAMGLVLYSAEYDSALRLLGELEVTALRTGAEVTGLQGNWHWSPLSRIERFASIAQAVATIDDSTALVSPQIRGLVPDYPLLGVHMSENPLNGSRSLVATYSDGIDAFFVIQLPGQPDPLQGAPSGFRQTGGATPHTISYFDDPTLRVYLFHHDSVDFRVSGRGTLNRLEGVARAIYRQAIRR